jgi:hypothetical protein
LPSSDRVLTGAAPGSLRAEPAKSRDSFHGGLQPAMRARAVRRKPRRQRRLRSRSQAKIAWRMRRLCGANVLPVPCTVDIPIAFAATCDDPAVQRKFKPALAFSGPGRTKYPRLYSLAVRRLCHGLPRRRFRVLDVLRPVEEPVGNVCGEIVVPHHRDIRRACGNG